MVVIGASAGGVEAVSRIVSDLPADFPAAVFVALHFPSSSNSVLPRILTRAGALEAKHPSHGEAIRGGTIYVAPPDQHLLIRPGHIALVRGPRENGSRPAIDPMFRSAAVAYGAKVVGVVLTGNLDDGTAGLLAIKRRGGVAIVQDPSDALFASMPASALEHVPVDRMLSLEEIGAELRAIVAAPVSRIPRMQRTRSTSMNNDDAREVQFDSANLDTIEDVEAHPGELSQFGCPDCGGVLWQITDGELTRFRCRVGHAWTAHALMATQAEQLDNALWTALRALEESASLMRMMLTRARDRGNDILAAKFERDIGTTEERAQVIRTALGSGPQHIVEASLVTDAAER